MVEPQDMEKTSNNNRIGWEFGCNFHFFLLEQCPKKVIVHEDFIASNQKTRCCHRYPMQMLSAKCLNLKNRFQKPSVRWLTCFFCLSNFKRMKRVLHFRRKNIVFPKTNSKFTFQKWAQLLPFKRKGNVSLPTNHPILSGALKLLLSRFCVSPFFLREIT